MSSVSLIGKLLNATEVEWRSLGDVGTFIRGKRFVKTDILSEGVPCIHYGEMYTHFGISAKNTKSFLNAELASNLRCANYGDVIVVAAGETVEDIGNGTAWIGDGDVVIHDACFSYKSKLNPTYVSYFLRTKNFKEQIKKHVSSGKISSINSRGLGKAIIPIPYPDNPQKSLEIQAEIVRILDAFTELTAELTAELTERKKQYNYYRNKLLSFEDREVEWKQLGDICENISSGKNKNKSDTGLYPVFGSTGIIGKTNNKIYDKPQILVARVGANAGRVNIALGEYDVSDNTLIVQNKENIVQKFLYYYLVKINLNQFAKGAGQPLITAGQLKTIKIPLPIYEEQARIVAILDKFDALTISITEGLPREIALRQKQYEYYRGLLLSFPKQEGVAT